MKKFNEAESVEEVLAFAKEEGADVSEAELRRLFNATRKGPEGELADDELDNVAGGACYISDGRMVTSVGNSCRYRKCYYCGGKIHYKDGQAYETCDGCGTDWCVCNKCSYCTYEGGLWLCNHTANYK